MKDIASYSLDEYWKIDISQIPYGPLKNQLLAIEPVKQQITLLEHTQQKLGLKPGTIVKNIPHTTQRLIKIILITITREDVELLRKGSQFTSVLVKPSYCRQSQTVMLSKVDGQRRSLPYGKRLNARD